MMTTMVSTLKTLEQFAGVLLMIVVLLDVFLTVLYARIETGILSTHVARIAWSLFRAVAQRRPSNRGRLLSFCGPTILVVLVIVWGMGLTVGAALILQPYLGSMIKASGRQTGTDFVSAMFAGGSSISILGSGEYAPQSGSLKMFYLFNSLVGMSVMSLTLTYIMQIYAALQRRNSVGLALDIGAGRKGDAAELIVGLGPQGHFESGYSTLAGLAESIASIKEAHHFYPVLFYFRFEAPYYSVSRVTNVALDTVTIIRTALNEDRYRWFIQSGAVANVWDASLLLLVTLQDAFLETGVPKAELPDMETRERWRQRFFNAVVRLQTANIEIAQDLEAAATSYVALRSAWSAHITNLAPSMMYPMHEIDPVGSMAVSDSVTLPRAA